MAKNIFYAQSGGVTAVINTTAQGVIETAKKFPSQFNKIYAGRNGILGALHDDLIDISSIDAETLEKLKYTPGGIFGSCRYKLKSPEENPSEFSKLIEVFKKYEIKYFFYNGGGDSQDTINKIAKYSQSVGYPLTCIGIPKTIDNDLALTDNSPGFGSVAKYVAISTLEATMDVASMYETSTKVFILEVMGRHTGWIAAASGLIKNSTDSAPHIILFPEIEFDVDKFLSTVDKTVKEQGYCIVVSSEGIKDKYGNFISDSETIDSFGHKQLGGVAPLLSSLISNKLSYKNHYAAADYLQRSARHIASQTDLDQSYAVGEFAVKFAIEGENNCMPIIVRKSNKPYTWTIGKASLDNIANIEKKLPKEYISENGYQITKACKDYLLPLIQGEAYPPYKDGLPDYVKID